MKIQIFKNTVNIETPTVEFQFDAKKSAIQLNLRGVGKFAHYFELILIFRETRFLPCLNNSLIKIHSAEKDKNANEKRAHCAVCLRISRHLHAAD
jgi:hypothetical protein